jgi:hypothetical protein
MLGVIQYLIGQTGFHHLATAHDDQALRQQASYRQIMGDNYDRQS